MKRLICLVIFFGPLLTAQTAGVMPEWQIREEAVALDKQAAAVESLLAQLKPEEWIAQGAPEAYVDQLKQTRQFNSYMVLQAQALARTPGKLSVALDTFLRLEHVRSLLESLTAGARKYQNSALADLLFSALSQNSTTLERLKEYVRQLSVEREQEWEIANREAQRCRESLAKRPPALPAKKPAPASKPEAVAKKPVPEPRP